MSTKKFPKTVYITRDADSAGDEFLNVQTDLQDEYTFDETKDVAVYELREVGQVIVKREYKVAKKSR